MAEILSLVASIVQVASFGLSLSRTLHDYGSSVVGAEKRLKGLDKQIEFTARIISQIGNRLQDSHVQALVSEDTIRLTQDAVAECDAIFNAMQDIISKVRGSGNMGRWTLYFRDTKIELLTSNLDRMKGNLNLLMGVIIHGTQMASDHPDQASITAHRAKIRELMIEKEQYTQRYLEEKRRYDELLEKINSNSTIGSILILATANDTQVLNGVTRNSNPEEGTVAVAEAGQSPPPLTYTAVSNGSPRSASSSSRLELEGPPFEIEANQPTSVLWTGQASATPTHSASPAQQDQPQPPSSRHSASSEGSRPAPTAETPSALHAAPGASRARLGVPKRRKRDETARTAKKAAKGAGIAISVIVGAALFPITVPIYIIIRRRRKRIFIPAHGPHLPTAFSPFAPYGSPAPNMTMAQCQPQQTAGWVTSIDPSPENYYYSVGQSPAHFQSPSSISSYYTAGGMSYDSARLPAELPALHELSEEEPDLALVGRLIKVEGYGASGRS